MLFCRSHLIRKLIHFIKMYLHSFQLSFESFFKTSIYIRQRGLVRPKIFLLGGGAIALRDSLAPVPWHARVNSTSKNTVAQCVDAPSTEGKAEESWKYDIKGVLLVE